MTYVPENPLIVQGDLSVLLEVQSPRYEEARDRLLAFAELVKSPEYVHTWRITPLSLWNAAAAGHEADEVIGALSQLAKYPIPDSVPQTIRDRMARYGRLRLLRDGEWLVLEADDPLDLEEIRQLAPARAIVSDEGGQIRVHPRRRGELKQVLVHLGHPVEDLAGYEDGDALAMALTTTLPDGLPWGMREYQIEAVDAFFAGPSAGSGVVVLPCGAGKTVVGVATMVRLGMRTLILCTGHTALRQWRREILSRTNIAADQVGEFSADIKEIRPITLTTYQMLAYKKDRNSAPAHFELFHSARWGLVIYDEVHLLPAPIFRETASLQALRRLGLTATLVREDGCEADVFALIGPKRFDLPWKTLEHQGWIASARCVEIRVPLSETDRVRYISSPARARFKIASTNPRKIAVLEAVLARHEGASALVLGTDLEQLGWIAKRLGLPIVTGDTSSRKRDEIFERFREGLDRVLVLSKVGNFAIDLPEASIAVQVSGTFGSRAEEAQRLGRILRPKEHNQAVFYTLVTSETDEQIYAEKRQLFLAEQGYPYRIETAA